MRCIWCGLRGCDCHGKAKRAELKAAPEAALLFDIGAADPEDVAKHILDYDKYTAVHYVEAREGHVLIGRKTETCRRENCLTSADIEGVRNALECHEPRVVPGRLLMGEALAKWRASRADELTERLDYPTEKEGA